METSGIKRIDVTSPAEMIKTAINGGADLEKLAKLLDLQERWEANEARKAFNQAMSDFKSNPPKIQKDRTVKYKDVRYHHASLANVVEAITKALSEYGLCASWRVSQNGQISVTCRISHALGHFEETTLSAPADNSGSKNSIQAIGSTITYLERYTLLALTGLATEEQDDDGVSAVEELVDEKQLGQLCDWMNDTKTDEAKFCKYLGVESLDKLLKRDFSKALNLLQSKKKAAQK